MKTIKVVVELNTDRDSLRAWNRAILGLIEKEAIKEKTTGNILTWLWDLLKQRVLQKRLQRQMIEGCKWTTMEDVFSESKGE